jgi:hypothetical protein
MSTLVDNELEGSQDILDSQQAAQLLGLSADALRKRIARGTLDGFKSNGRWYVRNINVQNDIIALLRQQISVKDEQIRELHSLLANAQQAVLESPAVPLPPPSPRRPWWLIWR